MLGRTMVLVFSLLVASCTAKQAPAANRLADGRAIYYRYCRQCHARFTLMSKELNRSPGFQELYNTVRDGRQGTPMFGFGTSLTEPELEAVVQYIQRALAGATD